MIKDPYLRNVIKAKGNRQEITSNMVAEAERKRRDDSLAMITHYIYRRLPQWQQVLYPCGTAGLGGLTSGLWGSVGQGFGGL